MRSACHVVAGLTAVLTLASAQQATQCGDGKQCPSSSPCCSSYGQCGVGAYCLGGCDPRHSFDLQSCVPAPVCKSGDYTFQLGTDVQPNTRYLGDASQALWVSSGTPAAYQDNSILLTMPADSVGTLLSSTHYVWYGKISATLATSQGAGVVTAFIMMSDMKDEIDFEFVGVDLQAAQSNFYFQGITDYDNGKNLTTTNTRENFHTYEIDWKPDTLSWSIDGQVMRTVNRKDTFNTTDNTYHYPQTPSRVQLSIWPAGLSSNGAGTIAWSGGLVNWDSQYMQNGYYYAQVKNVNVECYDPPSGYQNNGNDVYYYTNTAGIQSDVATGNNNTVLASFYASGDNMKDNPNAAASSSGSKATGAAEPQTVPGISGGGVRSDGSPGSDDTSSSSGSSSGSGSGSSGPNVYGSTSFSQGIAPAGKSAANKVMAGSVVALIGFFVAALML